MKQFASLPTAARLLQLTTFGAATLLALPALALDAAADHPVIAHAPAAKAASAAASASSSAGSGSLTMLFGLVLVLGLIAGIAWFLKRSGLAQTMQPSAAAKIVGGVSVGNRERVVVVEVADLWIVVGVAPGQVNALATMPKQESISTGAAPAAKNFSSWMKQTIEKRNVPR